MVRSSGPKVQASDSGCRLRMRPQTEIIVAYIDAYKDSCGVAPICSLLKEHDYQIAPSTYYAFNPRPPPNRAIYDELLLDHIKGVHRDNYSCYDVRKVWYSLLDDVEVLIKPGRDQVAMLMRRAGLRGIRRLKRVITTVSDPEAPKSEDMVKREWDQGAPDRVWVADFTEVRSREGVVYVAFVQDAGTRNILGFNVRTSRPAELVETALEQAVNTRSRLHGRHWLSDGNLICHSDQGSQGGFKWSSQHLGCGGARWASRGSRCLRFRLGRGASGRQIGRYDRRCGHRGGRSRRVRCSVSSGA